MKQVTLVIKFLPVLLQVFDALGRLYSAYQARERAEKANQNTTSDQSVIDKQTKKLIDIGYDFLPTDIKKTAEVSELRVFAVKAESAVTSLIEAVQAGAALTK